MAQQLRYFGSNFWRVIFSNASLQGGFKTKLRPVSIVVPDQDWQRISEQSCVYTLATSPPKDEPIPLKTVVFEGNRYVIFSVTYGKISALSEGSFIVACRLTPIELFQGEAAIISHDEEAIQAGRRGRGDMRGFVLLVNRRKMVCDQFFKIEMGILTTKPMVMVDAIEFDKREKMKGWRSLLSDKTPKISWQRLNGHPVAVYKARDSCLE